jgi:ABC-type sugar transport system substrate-binding protein
LGETGFVASITCTQESTFQTGRTREMAEMLDALGLRQRVYESGGDDYNQLLFIEQARLDGAKAFIICPLETELLIDSLESIAQAQYPVAFTTLFNWTYGVKLDSNSREIGIRGGEFAGQIIRDEFGGQARVVILTFLDFPAGEARAEGMIEGLRRYAPAVEIVGTYQGFTRDDGRVAIERLLAEGVAFDAVLTLDDSAARGVVDALEAAQIPQDTVFIVSANAEPIAQQLIREGRYLRGSVDVNRAYGSQVIVNAIVKMLAGSPVPERLSVPPGDMVTIDNVDSLPSLDG